MNDFDTIIENNIKNKVITFKNVKSNLLPFVLYNQTSRKSI